MLPNEKTYSIRDLSRKWNINYHTVRRWFIKPDGSIEPGVILAGTGKVNKLLQIPESVAARAFESRRTS